MKMAESGVDQLIQRVKAEAIEKAHHEKLEILNRAQADARDIIEKAQEKADALLRMAQATVNNEKRKLTMELTIAARDFSIKLSERLKAQMLFPNIKKNVRATLKEPDFLKEVLTRLIDDYIKHNPANIDVLVPKELKTTLAAFFAGSIFDNLDTSCKISLKDEEGFEGFMLQKEGNNFVWDFSVETIAQEIMRLVEPSLRKYFTASQSGNHVEIIEHARA
jgi:V/A-type H+/Na+-transporting ATPase subunit E